MVDVENIPVGRADPDKEAVVVKEAASTLGFLEGKLGAACTNSFTGYQRHDGFEQSRVFGLCRSLQWKND